jgi:tetraacyldisaccharide 4'-kinase
MRPPGFWEHDGLIPRLLAPLSNLAAELTARRMAQPGWRVPVPVVCCGNASVGGTGKTTLALDLGVRLTRRGARVAFLTRGYRSRSHGTSRVSLGHDATDVGDEAMLLSEVAPTFVGADRVASARAAVAAGATVLVMDDGLQNPGLVKDLSFLVIDGAAGFGNGRVLPGGPLREPVAACARRCHAAILIGEDRGDVGTVLPASLAVLRARLQPQGPDLTRRRVVAFAGIGRPAKFFATLQEAGAEIAWHRGFPDHHAYHPAELRRLEKRAAKLDAVLVTTPKDAVRLPLDWQAKVLVAGVSLAWADDSHIETLLGSVA